MPDFKSNPLPSLTHSDIERFYRFIDKRGPNECWPWLGAKYPYGYGKFSIRHDLFRANRIALFLRTGIDPGELKALHSCDNPPCCNGAHIFGGSKADNTHDMCKKGRQGDHRAKNPVKGETHPASRLTANQVRTIRLRYAEESVSQDDLGTEFGVSRQHIGDIVNRRRWRHLS